MTWFRELMGFTEESPEQVRSLLQREGQLIRSTVNGAEVGTGWLEVPRLDALRALDRELPHTPPSRVREVVGDVRHFHRDRANAGALFQAASQFNLLEMTSPHVTPEAGVGIYSHDHTQGPTCAIACGGGTILRNYYAPVGNGIGQTADRQIDALADLEAELGSGHWEMRNGYALATEAGLRAITERLEGADEAERERLKGLLRIGVQHQVPVLGTGHAVTQVYGSALPVAYGAPAASLWEPFARLILEASYEATLRLARIWQAEPVYLTLLGGGVFGNDNAWIADAMVAAVERVGGLDVRIVSYGGPHPVAAKVVRRCASDTPLPHARTSRSHPIRVDPVEAPGGPPLGMTFAPGKVQPSSYSGGWKRSLEADLHRLRHVYGIDDLVCLVEDHELHTLHITALPERAAAHGIRLHRLPIVDGRVPERHAMRELVRRIQTWRLAGRRVAVHCMGGLGRAGTTAASLLIHTGSSPAEALAAVRKARPGAVETQAQEAFLQDLGRPPSTGG